MAASTSVTVSSAVGCHSSSLRDSAPWPAPSSRILGSGTSATSSSAIRANFSVLPKASPVHSSARITLRFFVLVDVVAVEVLQAIGLQQPVDARCVGPAPWHAVNVDDLGWPCSP